MFKIIVTIITLALIATSCNHNQRNKTNYRFDYQTPDYAIPDNHNSIIENAPTAREIPEPSFLFSYTLITLFYVIIKKNIITKV